MLLRTGTEEEPELPGSNSRPHELPELAICTLCVYSTSQRAGMIASEFMGVNCLELGPLQGSPMAR